MSSVINGLGGLSPSLWSRMCRETHNNDNDSVDGNNAGGASPSPICTQPTSVSPGRDGMPFQPVMGACSFGVQGLLRNSSGGRGLFTRGLGRFSSQGIGLTSFSSTLAEDCVDSTSSASGAFPVSVIRQQPQQFRSSSQASLQLATMLSGMSSLSGSNLFTLFGEDLAKYFTTTSDQVDCAASLNSELRDLLKNATVFDVGEILLGLGTDGKTSNTSPLASLLLSHYALLNKDNPDVKQLVELLQKINKESGASEQTQISGFAESCSNFFGTLSSSSNSIVGAVGIAGKGLADLLALAAKSQRFNKSVIMCHDSCKPCCTRSCGCDSCGCAGGEGGCGGFGSFLCGCAEIWCCNDSVQAEADLTDYVNKIKELEEAVGSTIFMLGLQNMGITVADLTSGSIAGIPSPEQLEGACREAVSTIGRLMMRMSHEKWLKRFCSCAELVDNSTFWKQSVQSGLLGRTPTKSLPELGTRIKITTPVGGRQEAVNFNLELLLPALSYLQVTTQTGSEGDGLDIDQTSMILSRVCAVLSAAVGDLGTPVWMTPKQLTDLVCICMASCDISLIGGPSCEECKEFTCAILEGKCPKDRICSDTRNAQAEIRKLVVKQEAKNAFIDLLTSLRDPNSRESRVLLRECLSSWARRAGVAATGN
ncbi:hypothetical protein [Chlamydia suis]|uniref:hypothetical protein n=1 Tax=Chlamydia suis TaxID=83559 RepID=UPI0021559043|nr:hypothetical protein [Chlamydia suis]MEB2680915.1 hypothetical protein [Chlamydia suis]MEB2682214.1 hypothetical protein [Chlamydia suis]MEB2683139.1 hypothetical protein [Chlamydia suis]MEB2683624.1 hypothetical protein [Chlamydia suis]MEB2684952.1 hypothetical protein [Chlamydia suis]